MIEFENDNLRENEDETIQSSSASIKVIGIGGAGGNTINSMMECNYKGIDFIATNTDMQALNLSKAPIKIQFGFKSTKGLGTGADPELGRQAMEEDLDKIIDALKGADIVFLTAGMGGGTGSGALPVIAHALKEQEILTIAVVTKPFLFEGKRRSRIADEALARVRDEVDTLIIIPNQKLLEVVDDHLPMVEAFSMINDVLNKSVKGISDIISRPGHINVDFADVRAIMKGMGYAIMGTASATGENRAREAALKSISSPLLENMNITGAKGVLLNITGGNNLSLHEINEAANVIYEQADEDANIILGSVIDSDLSDEVFVTVIATGFKYQSGSDACRVSINEKIQATIPAQNTSSESDLHELGMATEDQNVAKSSEAEPTFEFSESKSAENEDDDSDNVDLSIDDDSDDIDSLVDINDLDAPTFMRNKPDIHEEKK